MDTSLLLSSGARIRRHRTKARPPRDTPATEFVDTYSVCIPSMYAPGSRKGGRDVSTTRTARTARAGADVRLPAAHRVRGPHRLDMAAQHRAGLHDAGAARA